MKVSLMIIYKILNLLSNFMYSGAELPLILSTPPESNNLVLSYTNKFSIVADNCLHNKTIMSLECVNAYPCFDVPELD